MQAGTLSQRVTLQAPSVHVDEAGQPLTGWAEVAQVWASVRHQSGLSAIRSGMDASSAKASIRIRRKSGVHAGMRVLHGGAIYDIQAVLPDEGRVHLDLLCAVKNAAA